MEYKIIDEIDRRAIEETLKHYGLVWDAELLYGVKDVDHISQSDLRMVKKSYFYQNRLLNLRMAEVGKILSEKFNKACKNAARNFDKFGQKLREKGKL